MSRLRALVTAAVISGGILLATPWPGVAADDASIAHVETTDKGLQILVSVPAESEVDLEGVSVTINGEDAPAEAGLAAATTDVRRTAVLAIDTSNSMRGDRFGSAKQAALEFIKSVPDDVYVGIVAFAGDVTEPLSPTLDRAQARDVVRSLELSARTRLYDGVLAAVEMAGTEGQRTVLVLSDGADTSDTDLETTTGAVAEAEILLDVVALDQSGPPLDALAALAEAGGGQVINADRNALSETFSEEAALLARQVLVTAQVPAGVSDNEATLVVTLPTAKAPIVVQAFAVVRASGPASPEALAPPATNHGWTPPDWVMYAGVGAVGVGLVGLLTMMVPSGPAPMTVTERVSQYTAPPSRHGSSSPKMDTDQALASAKDAAAGLLRRNQSLEARISHRLDGAGSALKSSEWLLLHGAIFVLAGLVGLLLGRGNIVIGLVFMAFGVFGPWVYLGLRRTRRRKAFNMALPETLQLMSGSMTAGLSLAQSVDTIVREGAEPIASEFKRVLVETRLGVSLEDAFNGVAERFESKDFEWVVMAIKIQRQVGGNLAELLDTVAATMREREYMRRQVAALAAEGKLSAIVLGGLPPLFLLYLLLTKRDYVMPMFTEPIGWVMLIGLGVLLSIGVFWMSRLIKVEV